MAVNTKAGLAEALGKKRCEEQRDLPVEGAAFSPRGIGRWGGLENWGLAESFDKKDGFGKKNKEGEDSAQERGKAMESPPHEGPSPSGTSLI